MNTLLILIILLILLGGGGFYYGGPVYGGSGIGLILVICIVIFSDPADFDGDNDELDCITRTRLVDNLWVFVWE